MDAWKPEDLKREIRRIAGRDLSCKLLQDYIENSADRDNLILQTAFVLRQPELLSRKTWNELQSTFMSRYSKELLPLLGLEEEWIVGEKSVVRDTDALIGAILDQIDKGNLVFKHPTHLANWLFNNFEFAESKRLVLLKIKR